MILSKCVPRKNQSCYWQSVCVCDKTHRLCKPGINMQVSIVWWSGPDLGAGEGEKKKNENKTKPILL